MEKSGLGKMRITLKEIGLPRLVLLLAAGIALLLLSLPEKDGTGNDILLEESAQTDFGIMQSGSGNGKASIGGEDGQSASALLQTVQEATEQLEERLTVLLRKVKGIGEVEVMITLKSSPETVVLKDAPYTSQSTSELDGLGGEYTVVMREQGEETVLTDAGYPYVLKAIAPEVEGVVVLAKGAADRLLVTEITEAVEVLFGVPAHKVKVMKME